MRTTILEKPSVKKPWLQHFPKESLQGQFPTCTIYGYLKDVCAKLPDRKSMYYYGTKLTYAALLQKVDQCANAFAGLGVQPGEIVSFLTVTTPETIVAMYALNKLGAVSNFIDPRMDINRIRDAISHVHSKVLVTLDLPFPKVQAVRKDLSLEHIIVHSANTSLPLPAKIVRTLTVKATKIPYGGQVMGWKDFLALRKKAECCEAPYQPGRTCVITYTGGTTGTPKGVELTDDGLNAVAESFRLSGVDHAVGQRFLDIMPVFAAYGVVCGIHMPFALGFENVLIPKFVPDELGKLIKQYHPSHMMGVPSFYERIMHSRDLWDVDLSFLLTTGCGGDTMNPGLEKRFNRFMQEHGGKYCLSQGYGMSELSGPATCCFSAVYKDDSAGIPLLGATVGIFHPDTMEELDFGQEGEICVTGPIMMKGYYNAPEETANVMRTHADGTVWVHSGDIGYLDEDGFLYVKGRVKQMIVRFDGHKVFPVQIESIVGKHKAVGTCAVVGIPDREHAQGQLPLVVVELKSTIAPDADRQIIRQEILTLCDQELEERGKPVDLVFVEEMPHTAMGKNNVLVLNEMFKDHDYRK